MTTSKVESLDRECDMEAQSRVLELRPFIKKSWNKSEGLMKTSCVARARHANMLQLLW